MASGKVHRRHSLHKEGVKWLSERLDHTESPRKIENCYSKFLFQSVVASVGDFILVLNADAIEPDTVDGSDVAKILQLYESENNAEDPYRAVVQWYSRVRELPAKVAKPVGDWPALCQEHEVVEETRPFDNDISLETVYRCCKVVFVQPSKDPGEVAREEMNGKLPLFVCRFRLVCRGRKSGILEPVCVGGKVESASCKLKQSRRKIFPESNGFMGEYKSPGQQTPKHREKIKNVESDLSDSDLQIINCSSKHKPESKQLLLSSSTNRSGHGTPEGSKNNSDVLKAECLKSSERKRKTYIAFSDSDDDSATKSVNFSAGRKIKTSCSKTASCKKLSGKHSRGKVSAVFGKTCVSGGKSKARRKLSAELENLGELQQASSDELPNSDSDGESKGNAKHSTPVRKRGEAASSGGTPSMPQRKCSVSTPTSVLEEARARLHVSAVPQELPCREPEFQAVYHFLRSKLLDNVGGCMYISGVPGTGKTATVHEVLNYLQSEVDGSDFPQFKLVKINGMQLTEPRQAYVEILHQLTGQKMKSQQAQQILDKRFKTAAPRRAMTVLIVDELDLLCTRRQDVVYNLLDWPNYSTAHLVVVTIANTMDLPERSFISRVNSRMGLTRITFQPYTYVQLQKIVMSRLTGLNAFDPDAVQLIARKVAAVSGDARRALDMCRRATEISSSSSEMVTMGHVNHVLQEMITSPKIQAIRSCSVLEQAFLRAVAVEVGRTGVEETVFSNVYNQLYTLCLIDNLPKPSISQAFGLCARLGACRLLLTEHSCASTYQRIILNVSTDDVHYSTLPHN